MKGLTTAERNVLKTDYWDLNEVADVYGWSRERRINYLERALKRVEALRSKCEAEDATDAEQMLKTVDAKKKEIEDVLHNTKYPTSSMYEGDPLAKYFNK